MNKNKYRINLINLILIFSTLFTLSIGLNTKEAEAYTLEKWGDINANMSYTNNKYIVAHETANPNAGLRNEANNMLNNWQRQQAFTQFVVGTDSKDGKVKVVQVASPGKVAWGAGTVNPYAYAQVELANTTNKEQFEKEYPVYVNLLRDMALRAGIPLTLDNPINGKGIISHDYVSKYLWQGDWHTDPYGYLAKNGISKTQFAKDLQTGLKEDGSSNNSNNNSNSNNNNSNTNNQVKPWAKTQTVDVDVLNVRSEATTNSNIVRQVKKGQLLKTKAVKEGQAIQGLDGKSYTSWFQLENGGWVSGALVTEYKQQTQSNTWKKENGTYVFNINTNIRSQANTNSNVVGYYTSGMSVSYDSYKVDNNGFVWIHYVSYSGQDRYVATGESINGSRVSYWGNFY